ncbi:MAG: TIR domain-containing protein [Chloroflexi bacterium]|nr:TIR domain-containing protein [Chloroflexota bacterium]
MITPEPAYSGDKPFLFVSYAHVDADQVLPEVAWLQSLGLNAWWDEGISGGSRWRDEIAGRITNCHVLLFYVSPDSVQSPVCREELEYALAHDRPVLLVHLSDTEIPDGIKLASSNRQALFRHELAQENYERKVLQALTGLLGQDPIERASGVERPRVQKDIVPALLAMFALVLLASVLATWWLVKPEPTKLAASPRFYQITPFGTSFFGAGSTHLTINKAGTHIYAIAGRGYPDKQIYRRPVDGFEFSPVPDSGLDRELIGVIPDRDGQTLLLTMREGKVGSLSVDGGDVVPIATTKNGGFSFHARWSGPKTVLLQDHTAIDEVTWRDGAVARRTLIERGVHPFAMPDGEHLLYVIPPEEGALSQIAIRSLFTGEEKILVEGLDPRFAPSGHLLYFNDNAVWAVRFDPDTHTIKSEPAKALEGVVSVIGKAQYEFADTGVMVYLPPFEQQMGLRWVSRQGLEKQVDIPPQLFDSMHLSPDATAVALAGTNDLTVFSFEDNLATRVARFAGRTTHPIWVNNGSSIVVTEYDMGARRIWLVDVATLKLTQLLETGRSMRVSADIPGENAVLVNDCRRFGVDCNISRLSLSGSGELDSIIEGDFSTAGAVVSPDGQYMAYRSDEFGPGRIVVRPYPDVSSAFSQIPAEGCAFADWSADGTSLTTKCHNAWYSVPVDGLDIGEPSRLFELPAQYFFTDYAPSRDQFLVARIENFQNLFAVVLNWFDELDRLTVTGSAND